MNASCPSVPWQTHAHDHHYIVFEFLQQCAIQCFAIKAFDEPRKPWLSEAAWALMIKRRELRHARTAILRELNVMRKYHIFSSWRRGAPIAASTADFIHFQLVDGDYKLLYSYQWLRSYDAPIRDQVKIDRCEHFTNLAVKADTAARENNTKVVYAIAKELAPAKERKAPMLALEDGSFAKSYGEIRQRWMRHHAEKLGGEIISPEQLLEKNLRLQALRFDRHIGTDLEYELLPSLIGLAHLVARSSSGKGCGEDVLPYELLKTLPQEIARILWPIMLKCATRFQEPLAWKGGMLAELLKKSGCISKCSDHRGILISDASGKTWHTTVRSCLSKPFSASARETQYGGIAHRGTDFCSLALRSYFNIAETSGRCAIAMFVDVIGAFDALIRRFVSDERADDIRVIAIIQQLGLPPSVMHDFVESLSEASISILPSLGVSAHLAAIIEDALSCTWHTVQGCEEMTEPVTGCKPGDPLADMLFCFLMIKVLRKIDANLKNAGISFTMPPLKALVATTMSFYSNDDELVHSDATYADDSVFMSQLSLLLLQPCPWLTTSQA